eukprot:6194561-Pleurochrysis_carterae.AAC.3
MTASWPMRTCTRRLLEKKEASALVLSEHAPLAAPVESAAGEAAAAVAGAGALALAAMVASEEREVVRTALSAAGCVGTG